MKNWIRLGICGNSENPSLKRLLIDRWGTVISFVGNLAGRLSLNFLFGFPVVKLHNASDPLLIACCSEISWN